MTHTIIPDSEWRSDPEWRSAALSALWERNCARLASLTQEQPQWADELELLSRAARNGYIEECIGLIDSGASIEFLAWGFSASTPMKAAAVGGHIEVMKLLLSRGARVDGLDVIPNAPLMGAVAWSPEATAFLVEAGADLDRDSLLAPTTALGCAEDYVKAPFGGPTHQAMAEYLRSLGATDPWNYGRTRPNEGFWDDTLGMLTVLLAEHCLGVTHAKPVAERRSQHARIEIRRARHGWKSIFQTLYSAGLTLQGGHCEVGLCLTRAWPLHRSALLDPKFRCPVDFLLELSDRVLRGAPLVHGDVLGREHELVRGLDWPGSFDQWLVVRHQSLEARRREIGDPMLPEVLLLVPHLDKKPLKPGKDAIVKADAKAQVKWEKPAASGGRNNLVVPLCYDGPWLAGRWY